MQRLYYNEVRVERFEWHLKSEGRRVQVPLQRVPRPRCSDPFPIPQLLYQTTSSLDKIMLRGASNTLTLSRRRLISHASAVRASSTSPGGRTVVYGRALWLAGAVTLAAGTSWISMRNSIHNDAPTSVPEEFATTQKIAVPQGVSPGDGSLTTLVWGANRCVRYPHDRQVDVHADAGPTSLPRTTRFPSPSAHPRLRTGSRMSHFGT